MALVVAVSGGKGGTGKTVVAACLASELAKLGARVLLADLDADNPCASTLFREAELREIEVVRAFVPHIVEDKCTLCGECVCYCPVHALALIPGKRLIFIETLCEGCATCLYVCPHGAIAEGERILGWIKEGEAGYLDLLVGEARAGERKTDEISERALERALERARDYDVVILDSPPGTGRGVYEILRASDLVLAITEPTRLGLHDLERLYRLLDELEKRSIVVVNKYGLRGGTYREVEDFVKKRGLMRFSIPYDRLLLEAYVRGLLVTEAYPDSPSAKALRRLAQSLAERLETRW